MARKRKNGEGTVRLRKDGRWEGRYVVGYDDNGNPKTKNVLAKTKCECVEKLKKLKESLGGIKSDKIKPDMPFGDWMEYWYENHCKPKLRPTTQQGYSPKWPDGKKHSRNIYAPTREECVKKLKQLIVEMKAEIAEAQRLKDLGEGDGRPPRGEERQAGEEEKKVRIKRITDMGADQRSPCR